LSSGKKEEIYKIAEEGENKVAEDTFTDECISSVFVFICVLEL
jgi:hypothetical protein